MGVKHCLLYGTDVHRAAVTACIESPCGDTRSLVLERLHEDRLGGRTSGVHTVAGCWISI